ncbi:hypothetical protein DKX38_002555 [Salix brachista]|uniref:Uncharacterized protein n=1 Tax=Salix brachista TaxID=2182728 RepID=A0A5N5NN57_9ROSI|nr:hypothetical protein DKX38_002555 [Salix brachista]
MVDPWWSLLGASIPAIIAGQAWRMKKRRAEEQRLKSARGREKSSDEIFVCERVCTSKRMLKKVGALSKDPTIDTCVTVCGVSELDACADACARTVCVSQHQVPNWNDICLRRFVDMRMNCSTNVHQVLPFHSFSCEEELGSFFYRLVHLCFCGHFGWVLDSFNACLFDASSSGFEPEIWRADWLSLPPLWHATIG